MGQDDKIHNPVEQYMKYIMDQDKPEKPPETTTKPAQHLEIKGGGHSEAVRLSDTLKQSVHLKADSSDSKKPESTPKSQLFNINHHPVGFVLIILVTIVGYAAAFTLISLLLPILANIIGIELSTIGPIVGLLMLVAAIVGLLLLILAGKNYLLSRFTLTDFSIVHVLRYGLTGSKVYESSMVDIENIAVERTGLLSSLFNYGTIVVETPQGRSNLVFKYAPSPEVHAKAIQYAKLEYLANHRATTL